ncbi:MAG: glycoside hydrolase family 97 catalytic domain-containing protein, partial [Thermodesulfobacteriota bacterium]
MLTTSCSNKTVILNSPDNSIQVKVSINQEALKRPYYNIYFKEQPILVNSELGIEFTKTGILQNNLKIIELSYNSFNETYEVINGKSHLAHNHYNEAIMTLEETEGFKRKIILVFRAYNDGVAFRYTIPKQDNINDFIIKDELSTFHFPDNPRVWYLSFKEYQNSHEGPYKINEISEIEIDSTHIDLPVLIESKDNVWLAITEAALIDYAGLYLKKLENKNAFQSDLTPSIDNADVKVEGITPHKSPWRVLMIAETPGRLIETNLILNLNEPCKIEDTDWIKPGKTTWHWWNGTTAKNVNFEPGLNTATMKHYIDFCAENGIDYHALVDQDGQGWYGRSRGNVDNNDMMTSIPEIDLQEVLSYAQKKGVEIRVWLHWKNIKKQMKEAFPLYEKWGIKGFMMDFIDRSDQEMVNFCNLVVKEAAKYHMKVQFHGAYKPTGVRRTYPNLMNKEGVLNLEYLKWSDMCTPDHNLIVPFTRMLAGPMDYHLGGFRSVTKENFSSTLNNIEPVVMGTRCHHLAMYVVYESPFQMVSDHPLTYKGQLSFSFIKDCPATWDETIVINGYPGEYITVVRRNGNDWFLGS